MAQYLLEKGYVTQEQLDEGQKVLQQSKSSDLGRVLVELGYVGEREMLESKAQEVGLNCVELVRYQIESGALCLVAGGVVRYDAVVPGREGGCMV
jgi:hypothetical protein